MSKFFKATAFQLKKDKLFHFIILLCILILGVAIYGFVAFEDSRTLGVESFVGAFYGSDLVIYAFMLLIINLVVNHNVFGVHKTIFGRNNNRTSYYLGTLMLVTLVYIVITLLTGLVLLLVNGTLFGMGSYSIELLIVQVFTRIFYAFTHFVIALTLAIVFNNLIGSMVIAFLILNFAKFIDLATAFTKFQIDLSFLSFTSSMVGMEELVLSKYLYPNFLMIVYVIVFITLGIKVLNRKEIK